MTACVSCWRPVVCVCIGDRWCGLIFAQRESRSANLIRAVQKALTEQGFDAGPLDGLMGPKMRAGIRSFPAAEGLPVTGAIDDSLLIALGLWSQS